MRPPALRIVFVVCTIALALAQPVDDRTYSEIEHPFHWNDEGIEFAFEPSFRDGFVIQLLPRDGKAELYAHKLHRKVTAGSTFHAFVPAEKLAQREISTRDFDAIVSAMERHELHQQSERTRVGPDGSSWTFRRQIGGRVVVLKFWSPAADSEAGQLGARLARAANIDPKLLDER